MVRILFCSMHTRYILPCPDLDHFQFASLLRPRVSLWALTESSPTPRNDVPLVVAGASVPPMTGSGRHIGFTVFHAHKTSMSQELRQLRQLRSWLWDPYGLRSKVSGYGFGTELVAPLGMLCVLSKFMNCHERNGLSHCFPWHSEFFNGWGRAMKLASVPLPCESFCWNSRPRHANTVMTPSRMNLKCDYFNAHFITFHILLGSLRGLLKCNPGFLLAHPSWKTGRLWSETACVLMLDEELLPTCHNFLKSNTSKHLLH